MKKAPVLPQPPTAARSPSTSNAGIGGSSFTDLLIPPGIFTSPQGALTRASSQRTSVTGA